jgi:hypothetical protein
MQKELAYRENDGIAVTLFWQSDSNRLSISVYDWRNGDWFELEAGPRNALDVFEHPYAYAAQSDPGRALVRDAVAA